MHPTEVNERLDVIKDVLSKTPPDSYREPTQFEYDEMERNARLKAKVFHNTVHVYGNDSYRHHCVPDFELEGCIQYNSTMRFGRAIFVDGKCVHPGYLDSARVEAWELKIKDWPMSKLKYPRN